jgi:hypothetical protein
MSRGANQNITRRNTRKMRRDAGSGNSGSQAPAEDDAAASKTLDRF